MENAIGFIFRYFHVLAGITWIGMLYYFNFVQTEYFKEAEVFRLNEIEVVQHADPSDAG